jgi:hypothetical protein
MPVSCVGKVDGWSKRCDVDGSRMLLVVEVEETVAGGRRENCRPGHWPCHFAIVIAGVVEVRFQSPCSVHMPGVRALAVLGRGKLRAGIMDCETAYRGGYR